MAAPRSALTARIERLEAAQKRAAALPKGTMLSSKPMREMLSVSWKTLREWADEIDGFDASGAFVRGSNGIEWEFDPRKTIAYLLKHFRGRQQAEAAASERITTALGVSLPAHEIAPSLAETKDLVNLTLTVVGAAERQGQMTRADRTNDTITRLFEAWSRSVMGIKTKLDPNGVLPPSLRKELEEALRRVCAQGREGVQEELRLLRADSGKARTG